MKNKAVYPGTFDPVTNGHLDIIKRAANMFDTVVVAVLVNSSKNPVFTMEQRVKHLKACTKNLKNVKVESFNGLLADFMKKQKAKIAIRGLRAVSDLEYEFQIAHTNRKLNKDMDTIFLMPSARYTYLTSSIVREVYRNGGTLDDCIPPSVEKDLVKAYKKQ